MTEPSSLYRMRDRRARMLAAGLCVDCGKPHDTKQRRCERCAERHRERNRADYVKRPRKGWRQTADLAELQAFKKGRAELGKEDGIPMAVPRMDFSFIRAQSPRAVPLLAKLYSVSEDKIRLIRGASLTSNRGDRMPLKLLEELVEQRTGKYYIDHFIERESSITECEKSA